MTGDRNITLIVSSDEMMVITLLRAGGPDADYRVIVRDGRVMNVEETKIHRKQFTPGEGRPIRECQG